MGFVALLSFGGGAELCLGGSFSPFGKRYRLSDLDPTTTNAERAANHVSLPQERLEQAERYTQEDPQAAMRKDEAPKWMKRALELWEREDA